ncbi:MAG: phosphatase PAP2 family protein [Silvanigrellaceae bacterium]
MNCDSDQPRPPAAECFIYTPGLWRQDLYTIPLEGLLVAGVSAIKPPDKPRWPFENESANADRNPTRQPGMFVIGMAASMAIPLGTLILSENPQFPVWTHLRGLIHTHLWTEVMTSAAKNGFGRKRPFYDTVARAGEPAVDDHRSFFSGHSSHSFAFATYASELAFDSLKNESTAWIFASLLNGTAAWIASSRYVDKQHNLSDVLVGSVVGAGVAHLTYQRVKAVSGFPLAVGISPGRLSVAYSIE